MTMKELRKQTRMTIKAFSTYFHIPYRTLQNWDNGTVRYPDYLLELMQYKLIKEGIIKEDL